MYVLPNNWGVAKFQVPSVIFFWAKQASASACFFRLGGGFKYFLFSSLLGEDSNFDEHIFQMG